MWRPGRRMFTVACILILLVAAAHNTGFLLSKSTGPDYDKTIAAMKDFHDDRACECRPLWTTSSSPSPTA